MVADCTFRAIRDAVADRISEGVGSADPDDFGHLLAALESEGAIDCTGTLFGGDRGPAGSLAPLRRLIDLRRLRRRGRCRRTTRPFDLRRVHRSHAAVGAAASTLIYRPRSGGSTLPGGADRDAQGLRSIDRVIEHWNSRLTKVPAARRDAVNDGHSGWSRNCGSACSRSTQHRLSGVGEAGHQGHRRTAVTARTTLLPRRPPYSRPPEGHRSRAGNPPPNRTIGTPTQKRR